VRVVGAWSLDGDALVGDVPVEAALVVASGPDRPLRVARKAGPVHTGSIDLTVPRSPAVVSVEFVAREASLAARARYGLPLTGEAGSRPALSDLLLIEPTEPLPTSLEAAVQRARGTTRVASGSRLGVFWEIYPPGGGPYDFRLSVRLRDDRGGFWSGLGAALGLSDRGPGAVALEWVEPVPAQAAIHPRALVLQLPDLPAGAYMLELELVLPDSRRARTERPIVVE
jgi:hypothetical protein